MDNAIHDSEDFFDSVGAKECDAGLLEIGQSFEDRRGGKMPTGMEDTDVRNQRSDVRKIILDDKMYIIYDGLMYDATGKRVTEINK